MRIEVSQDELCRASLIYIKRQSLQLSEVCWLFTIEVRSVSYRSEKASWRLVHLYSIVWRGFVIISLLLWMTCLIHLFRIMCKLDSTRWRRCLHLTLLLVFLLSLHLLLLHVTAIVRINIRLFCVHRGRIMTRRHHSKLLWRWLYEDILLIVNHVVDPCCIFVELGDCCLVANYELLL